MTSNVLPNNPHLLVIPRVENMGKLDDALVYVIQRATLFPEAPGSKSITYVFRLLD